MNRQRAQHGVRARPASEPARAQARAGARDVPALALVLALVLALALAQAPAGALTSDREKPVEISAGYGSLDPTTGQRILREDVRFVQGTLVIRADYAVVTTDEAGDVVQVELTGTPATWEEDLDDGTRLEAEAQQIEYERQEDEVLLVGDVVIDRGFDRITGDRIRYDLATSRVDAGGGEGRVNMRITPRSAVAPEEPEPEPADAEGGTRP